MNYTAVLIIHAIILIVVFVLDLYDYTPKWLKSFVMAFSLTMMVFIFIHTVYLRYKYSWMFTQDFRDNIVSVTNPEILSSKNIKQLIADSAGNIDVELVRSQSEDVINRFTGAKQAYLNNNPIV